MQRRTALARWWGLLLVPLVLVAAGCRSDTADDAAPERPVPVVTPTASESNGEAPDGPADAAGLAGEPRSYELVNWSEEGVVVLEPEGTARRITTAAASFAVLFDSGVVAYQTAPETIEIVDGAEPVRTVAAEPDRHLDLLDGAYFDDQPTLLVASRVYQPVGPDDAETRLLLIDAATGLTTDLGQVGGWESGVTVGRFAGRSIALLRPAAADNYLVILDLDGTERHVVQLATDTGPYALAAVPGGDEVAVMQLWYGGDDFDPMLDVAVANTLTGELAAARTVVLSPQGVEIDGACWHAAYTIDGTILCGSTTGPPLEITPGGPWATQAIDGLDLGAAAPAITS